MEGPQQAVFALKLALALAPLSIYLLILGLVNSRPRPCLVRSRADFVILSVVLAPVIAAPVMVLIEQGWLAAALMVALGAAVLFRSLMPAGDDGWVVYNIAPDRCRQLVERASRRLGWTAQADGERLRLVGPDVIVSFTALPCLRNVTVHLEPGDRGTSLPISRAEPQLMSALRQELSHEALLPSPTGATLVLLGASLLAAPLWCLLDNMEVIVRVVRDAFPL